MKLDKGGPVLWMMLGAALGGGGVYSLGLSRAPQKIHVGLERPESPASAAGAAAGAPAPAAAAPNAFAVAPSPAPADAGASGAAAPAPGAAPQQAPRPAGDRLMVVADQARPDMTATERSAAFAANAPAPAKKEEPARAPKAPAPAAASQHILASAGSVRYGMAGRSELMGRGAGPVYNLKGGGEDPGASSEVDKVIKQMGTIVQGAQAQLDQAPMDSAEKQKLKAKLQGATVGLAPSDPPTDPPAGQ